MELALKRQRNSQPNGSSGTYPQFPSRVRLPTPNGFIRSNNTMLIMQELLEAHEEIDLNRDTPDDHPAKGIEE